MSEEPDNADRAGWARTALNEYIDATRHGSSIYDLTPDNKDNNEEVIGDFLCDLHHLCDELGIDWEEQLSRGAMHYRDEAEEARQASETNCRVCSERIHRAALGGVWVHNHGAPECFTGDGATAAPVGDVDVIMELLTPDPWGQAETADARKRHAQERLEYLRGELEAERISTGELIELQNLVPYIEPGDAQLLEAAGVPEFPKEGK